MTIRLYSDISFDLTWEYGRALTIWTSTALPSISPSILAKFSSLILSRSHLMR